MTPNWSWAIAKTEELDFLLISMPFGPLRQPSLGLSLLKAALPGRRGEILYFNLAYARRIGWDDYRGINGRRLHYESLAGEWIFSVALDDEPARDDDYLDQVAAPRALGAFTAAHRSRLEELRRDVPSFLDWCVEQIVRRRPRIVGLTSVFQQHVASLALAKRLRQEDPEVVILLGGANCEGVMGLETARCFPFVDAVVSGEADALFPDLVERLLAGRSIEALPGVYTPTNVERQVAQHGGSRVASATRLPDLDRLPIPDYGDFFSQFHEYAEAGAPAARLLFETSRGCWWGAKQHCTFCGLNGSSMAFRSKSGERALGELTTLVQRYPGVAVDVVDNILDMSYFRDFIPALAEANLGAELFYEVKANLKKEQVRLLAAAGIREIQPGIESLSNQVLTLMRKGVTALQNIQLLKWCLELGVHPSWNFIWGFPGESAEEYRKMAQLVPWLHHLPPPGVSCSIQIHRFSPNFEQAEQLGFSRVEPTAAYPYLYPLPPSAIRNLAYYFDFGYADGREVESYTAELAEEVAGWQEKHASSQLLSYPQGDELVVWDLRSAAVRPMTRLRGPSREIFEACDSVRTLSWLCRSGSWDRGEVEALVAPWIESGLVVRDGECLLNLAIPAASRGGE